MQIVKDIYNCLKWRPLTSIRLVIEIYNQNTIEDIPFLHHDTVINLILIKLNFAELTVMRKIAIAYFIEY